MNVQGLDVSVGIRKDKVHVDVGVPCYRNPTVYDVFLCLEDINDDAPHRNVGAGENGLNVGGENENRHQQADNNTEPTKKFGVHSTYLQSN